MIFPTRHAGDDHIVNHLRCARDRITLLVIFNLGTPKNAAVSGAHSHEVRVERAAIDHTVLHGDRAGMLPAANHRADVRWQVNGHLPLLPTCDRINCNRRVMRRDVHHSVDNDWLTGNVRRVVQAEAPDGNQILDRILVNARQR